MPVHMLKKGLRVFDGFICLISDAGKGWGAPGADPPHAFPQPPRCSHVLDFLIEEGLPRLCGYVQIDLAIFMTAGMLVDVLCKFALLSPPMRGVGSSLGCLGICAPSEGYLVVESVESGLNA